MIPYILSKPEAYGCAGAYGNKYWVRVHGGTQEEIEKVLKYALKTCKKDRVEFPGFSGVKPMEITFFVYTDPKKESGVDAADSVWEWDKKEGLVKVAELKGGDIG